VRATEQVFNFRYRSAAHWLEVFRNFYGPTNRAFIALDAAGHHRWSRAFGYLSGQTANGVGWYVPDAQFSDPSSDIVISTAGYRPILQVTVPGSYRPEGMAAAMVQLAPMVKEYTKLVKPCH